MINQQARLITGMYSSTPIHPLLCEAGLIPASILLDYHQRRYTHRLLSLPDSHPTKEISPISLREGDRGFQPGEMPENTTLWTENVRPTLYGQWLHAIDPAEGVESVTNLASYNSLEPQVIIKSKKGAMEEARKNSPGLTLWTEARNWIKVRLQLQFVGKKNQPPNGKKKAYF